MIGPNDPNMVFEVDCDMETGGGGWTGLGLASMCNGDLDTMLTAGEVAAIEGIDEQCRPFTQDQGAQSHRYTFDIEFPPGFEEFYLQDYVFKAYSLAPGTTDIYSSCVQTTCAEPLLRSSGQGGL